jgi:mono/diheme cytochrome c family protein
VTEIPEHLLKRSRDRRAALGLGGGEAAGEEQASGDHPAAATTPATTAGAEPAAPSGPAPRKAAAAPAPPPPPPPDPPYVAAAKSRRKIPFWAVGALSLLPIWMFMYVRSLTTEPEQASGPLGEGAEVYGACASCHGATGGGGSGRPFTNGEVLQTFPHIEDQLRCVYFGTEQYNLDGVKIYGNPDREGGPHEAGSFGVMPAWGEAAGGDLTDAEILAVVCHERYDLGGADPTSDEYVEEYEDWCSEEAPAYASLESGVSLADLSDQGLTNAAGEEFAIIPIGDAPAPGSPPGE